MMLNTYNGRIYELEELEAMLNAAGIGNTRLFHLGTDTSVLLAAKDGSMGHLAIANRDMIEAHARSSGFDFARVMEVSEIAIEPWVRVKCQQGCSRYGGSLTCPLRSPERLQRASAPGLASF
jgi:hypothetical protein